MKEARKKGLPKSCVRWTDPLINAGAAIVSYVLFRNADISNTALALIVCLAVTLAVGAMEIRRAPWRRKARPDISLELAARRALVKWAGMMTGLACILAAWAMLPEYSQIGYHPLFEAMHIVLPLVPFVAAGVLVFTEWRIGPVHDHSWHMGLLALGRWDEIDWAAVRNGLLGWLVRGFFLPLNFRALVSFIGRFRGMEAEIFQSSGPQAHGFIILMISALLAAAIVPGYFFGARLTGTEIKKVDHSWFGWTVTLACYPPLSGAVLMQWFAFSSGSNGPFWSMPWYEMLKGFPALVWVFGAIILLIELIHYWGESVFGLRASNLSNRGIITNGPYRYCKHPVYFIKCVGWFMWMPFLSGETFWDCIRLTVLWACVCGIYYMRCWIEEKLLSDDKDYVAYALWIDKNGLFSRLNKYAPFLSYEWKLKRWKAQEA